MNTRVELTTEEIIRTILSDPDTAAAVSAFMALRRSQTWLAESIETLVEVSQKIGHLNFASDPERCEEIWADELQQLAIRVNMCKEFAKQFPALLSDRLKPWVLQKCAEGDNPRPRLTTSDSQTEAAAKPAKTSRRFRRSALRSSSAKK